MRIGARAAHSGRHVTLGHATVYMRRQSCMYQPTRRQLLLNENSAEMAPEMAKALYYY
jgi:hypothetical protein